MNIEIGSHEAKTKLPELPRGIRAGNRYTITLRGERVAYLVPVDGVREDDESEVRRAASADSSAALSSPDEGVQRPLHLLLRQGAADQLRAPAVIAQRIATRKVPADNYSKSKNAISLEYR